MSQHPRYGCTAATLLLLATRMLIICQHKRTHQQLPNTRTGAAEGAITAAGCRCVNSWNYSAPNGTQLTFTGGQCGTPDDDPAGPWCYVDAKSCQWQPFGQGAR